MAATPTGGDEGESMAVERPKVPLTDRSFAGTRPRAEAAIAALADQYPALIGDQLAHLRALMEEVGSGKNAHGASVAALFRVAHDIKGQGTSFGYPLMTRVAHNLCRLLRDRNEIDHDDLIIVQAHIEAMSTIIDNEITDEQSDLGVKLLSLLENLVQR